MARWQCDTCVKPLKPHGVARHRSMHRDRHDGPVVMKRFTATYVETLTYDWREDHLAALDTCPSCAAPHRLTLRSPCSLDQYDPHEWHRSQSGGSDRG